MQSIFNEFSHNINISISIQSLLFCTLIWLIVRYVYRYYILKKFNNNKNHKTNDKYSNGNINIISEEDMEKIQSWKPEPLVPEYDRNHFALNTKTISSIYGKYIIVNDRKCLNLATHNYLGLAEDRDCIDEAIKAVKKYGVGSCGPRGFFGTVDIHLQLEQEIAKFMQTEEAILYSYGYAAISSAIPAYSKSNDVIFADEAVNFAIQQGLRASRSRIEYFKHNDMKDLERILDKQKDWDNKHPKEAKKISRFMVVEGLYINTGDICPLKKIIELKRKHKVRLFIDDTCGFGVLGKNGRGIVEHSGCDLNDIDMISASLEYACASYGGFCTGTIFVIDHQRLSGLGYCFSASLPPLQAAYALKAIEKIKTSPQKLISLRENCQKFNSLLEEKQNQNGIRIISVNGVDISPIKHLYYHKTIDEWLNDPKCPSNYNEKIQQIINENKFDNNFNISYRLDTMRLEKITELAHENGYALTVSRYLERSEHKLPQPTIRLIINSLLNDNELNDIVDLLIKLFTNVEQLFFDGKFFSSMN